MCVPRRPPQKIDGVGSSDVLALLPLGARTHAAAPPENGKLEAYVEMYAPGAQQHFDSPALRLLSIELAAFDRPALDFQ